MAWRATGERRTDREALWRADSRGPREPSLDGSPDRTNPFTAAARGDKLATQPFSKLLWTQVCYKWISSSFVRHELNSNVVFFPYCVLVGVAVATSNMHIAWDGCFCIWQPLSKSPPKPSRNSRDDSRSVSNQVGHRTKSREILRDLAGCSLCMALTDDGRCLLRKRLSWDRDYRSGHNDFWQVLVQKENVICGQQLSWWGM